MEVASGGSATPVVRRYSAVQCTGMYCTDLLLGPAQLHQRTDMIQLPMVLLDDILGPES